MDQGRNTTLWAYGREEGHLPPPPAPASLLLDKGFLSLIFSARRSLDTCPISTPSQSLPS